MCDPITAVYVLAGAAVAGTAYTIYNGEKTRSIQNKANQQAKATAAATAQQAEEASNKANARRPDVAGLLAGNSAAQGGQGSTMLTGAGGIDLSQLTLGKNTLLGA